MGGASACAIKGVPTVAFAGGGGTSSGFSGSSSGWIGSLDAIDTSDFWDCGSISRLLVVALFFLTFSFPFLGTIGLGGGDGGGTPRAHCGITYGPCRFIALVSVLAVRKKLAALEVALCTAIVGREG